MQSSDCILKRLSYAQSYDYYYIFIAIIIINYVHL